MPALYVKEFPEDVLDALREGARQRSLSMAAYVREVLTREVARPTNEEIAAEIRKLPPLQLAVDDVLNARDADRA